MQEKYLSQICITQLRLDNIILLSTALSCVLRLADFNLKLFLSYKLRNR